MYCAVYIRVRKCWIIGVECWSEEYFGILCINHKEHYPSLSTADAVASVRFWQICHIAAPAVRPCLPPHGWAPVQV